LRPRKQNRSGGGGRGRTAVLPGCCSWSSTKLYSSIDRLYGILLWYIPNLPDDGSCVVVAVAASVGSAALAIVVYLLCWLFIGR